MSSKSIMAGVAGGAAGYFFGGNNSSMGDYMGYIGMAIGTVGAVTGNKELAVFGAGMTAGDMYKDYSDKQVAGPGVNAGEAAKEQSTYGSSKLPKANSEAPEVYNPGEELDKSIPKAMQGNDEKKKTFGIDSEWAKLGAGAIGGIGQGISAEKAAKTQAKGALEVANVNARNRMEELRYLEEQKQKRRDNLNEGFLKNKAVIGVKNNAPYPGIILPYLQPRQA